MPDRAAFSGPFGEICGLVAPLTSALVISQPSDHVFAVRLIDALGTRPGAIVDEVLAEIPELKRRRKIRFSWEMWPDFDPTKKLVRIDVPVRFRMRGWFNFEARVTYYLYLYIDDRSRLSGYVRWIETWVEGGTIGGGLNHRLNIRAVEAAGRVVRVLEEVLAELNDREWSNCYLMPGSVPDKPSEAYAGNTRDGVSLILIQKSKGSPDRKGKEMAM